jgi:hypothetical protein
MPGSIPKIQYWQCEGCKAIIKYTTFHNSRPINITLSGDRISYMLQEEDTQTIQYSFCNQCYKVIQDAIKGIPSKQGEIRE